jgi:hypothetical protein
MASGHEPDLFTHAYVADHCFREIFVEEKSNKALENS